MIWKCRNISEQVFREQDGLVVSFNDGSPDRVFINRGVGFSAPGSDPTVLKPALCVDCDVTNPDDVARYAAFEQWERS